MCAHHCVFSYMWRWFFSNVPIFIHFQKRWAGWGRRRTWAAARCSPQDSRQLCCCQFEPLSGVLPIEQWVEQDGQADDWGQRMVQRLPGFVPPTVTRSQRFVFNGCCCCGWYCCCNFLLLLQLALIHFFNFFCIYSWHCCSFLIVVAVDKPIRMMLDEREVTRSGTGERSTSQCSRFCINFFAARKWRFLTFPDPFSWLIMSVFEIPKRTIFIVGWSIPIFVVRTVKQFVFTLDPKFITEGWTKWPTQPQILWDIWNAPVCWYGPLLLREGYFLLLILMISVLTITRETTKGPH